MTSVKTLGSCGISQLKQITDIKIEACTSLCVDLCLLGGNISLVPCAGLNGLWPDTLLLLSALLSLAALPLPLLRGVVTSWARVLGEAGRSNENKWLSL